MMKSRKTAMAMRKTGITMAMIGGVMIFGSAVVGSMTKSRGQKISDKIMMTIDDVVSSVQNIMK